MGQHEIQEALAAVPGRPAHIVEITNQDRHPEIPWRSVYGFRTVAAHAYTGVELKRVWGIVEANLPALKTMVQYELGMGPRSFAEG